LLQLSGLGVAGAIVAPSVLAACGSDDESGGSGKLDKVKAHWVYIGPPDDNGWTQTHDDGRKAVAAALGSKVETAFTPNIGFDASTAQLFQQLTDDGNHIIFANTEYSQLLSDVAAANPGTKYVECNGHNFTANTAAYYMAHERTAYLLGIAAGLLTPNGKMGYIGAFPSATFYNDVNPMLLGARSVNPKATMQTVLISSYFDPQNAAIAADALLSQGVEFLFGVMDEPTFLQKAEAAGVWTGYWNLDFRTAAPTKYVNNFHLEWGPFYTSQVQGVLDGTWTSHASQPVLLDCPLGEWGDYVPQEVRDAVAEADADIMSGKLKVYEGPLVDNTGVERLAAGQSLDHQQAYLMDYAVEGVSGI
jgi:basic membrane lipoprotein Med (substrate-binding protein (PBP1-ABC) superfamily)